MFLFSHKSSEGCILLPSLPEPSVLLSFESLNLTCRILWAWNMHHWDCTDEWINSRCLSHEHSGTEGRGLVGFFLRYLYEQPRVRSPTTRFVLRETSVISWVRYTFVILNLGRKLSNPSVVTESSVSLFLTMHTAWLDKQVHPLRAKVPYLNT